MPKAKTNAGANPYDPETVRTLSRDTFCGWCMGADPNVKHNCKTDIIWYDKHWVCSCKCADARWEELNKK